MKRTLFAGLLVLSLVPFALQGQTAWNVDAAGVWSLDTNWSSGVPDLIGAQAVFGNVNGANSRTITVDGVYTVGTLTIENSMGGTYNIVSGTSADPRRLIMAGLEGGPALISINQLHQNLTFSAPMELATDLTVAFNSVETAQIAASRNIRFSGALLSDVARTVTVADNAVLSTGSNRTPLSIAFSFDNFVGDLQLRGTGATHASHGIELSGTIPAHVGLDIDTTAFIRAVSLQVQSATNFGNSTARFAANQGSAGNTNLRFVGPITGGGPDAVFWIEGGQGQWYLENPEPTSTFQGIIRIGGATNYLPNLWVSRDDQLGHASNPVQFYATGAVNSFSPVGGLSIASDFSTSRAIEVGANAAGTGGVASILVPEGVTLTLNGGAGQITRSADNTTTGHSFVKHGPGTLVLAGEASFNSGDHFRGNNNLVSGTLRLDNSEVNVVNRLGATNNSGVLRLANGRLEFVGGSSADQSETILRSLRLMIGGNEVLAAPGSGRASTITFRELIRTADQARGHFATVNFDRLGETSALGTAENRILFNSAPAQTNGIMAAWARVGNDWATYDATDGVKALQSYTPLAGATATDHALASSSVTLDAARNVASLKMDGSGIALDLGGQTLTVASGGILSTGSGNTLGGSGTLASGQSELVVVDSGSLALNANLGSYALVKAGAGQTTLGGTANNQTLTVINEGTLAVSANNQLGTPMVYGASVAGYVALAGGTLHFAGTDTYTRAIVLGATDTNTNNLGSAANPYSRNEISVADGVTATVTGKIVGGTGPGAVAFIKSGPGTLVLDNSGTNTSSSFGLTQANSGVSPNDFTGNIVLAEGILRATHNRNLGESYAGNPAGNVNDVIFRGGILELGGLTGNYSVGTSSNSRTFYVEEGGGSLRFYGLTASRNLSIRGSEGLVYRGDNPGAFHILEDVDSNGTFLLNVEYGTVPTAGSGTTAYVFRATGSESNYRGTTTLANGTLMVSANAPHGAPGALGNATSNVVLGTTSGDGPTTPGSNLAFLTESAGVVVGRNLTVNNSNVESLGTRITVGGAHASGTSIFSGNITMNRGLHLSAEGDSQVDFTGVLNDGAGSFSVTKVGSGAVRLASGNTFDGGTVVSAGTLVADHNNALGTGGVSLTGAGARLVLGTGVSLANPVQFIGAGSSIGGAGLYAGNLVVPVAGVVSPGNSAGTFSVGGDLELAGGYLWELVTLTDNATGTAGLDWDRIDVGGTLTYDNATITIGLLAGSLLDGSEPFWDEPRQWTIASSVGLVNNGVSVANPVYAAGSFAFNASSGVLSYTPIPEPGHFVAFLGLMAAALAVRRRLRGRKQA